MLALTLLVVLNAVVNLDMYWMTMDIVAMVVLLVLVMP